MACWRFFRTEARLPGKRSSNAAQPTRDASRKEDQGQTHSDAHRLSASLFGLRVEEIVGLVRHQGALADVR